MTERPIEIIAEAAEGYGGDYAKESALVDAAAAAGVDAVKFHLIHAEEFCTDDYEHVEQVRALEIPDERWLAASRRAHDRGLLMLFDVFGPRGLRIAAAAAADGVKIHASDALNHRFVAQVAAARFASVYVATGGLTVAELRPLLELLRAQDVTLVHGIQSYPTAHEDNCLGRLALFARLFAPAALGFADHTGSDDPARLWLAAAAVGAGATTIEKHLTLVVAAKDPDHQSAVNADELKVFATNMRHAAAAIGHTPRGEDDLAMPRAELDYRSRARRQLVALSDLAGGTTLALEHLAFKRVRPVPGVLTDPKDAIGRRLRTGLRRDEALTAEALA
jgi:N-acetylneuraminate synthase